MEFQKQTSSGIKIKLLFFYIFLVVDIISSSFIEPHFSTNNSDYNDSSVIPILVVQMVITLVLILTFFIMIWQSLPLRLGLSGELWRYFKWPMLISLLHLAITVIERVTRLTKSQDIGNPVDTKIWSDSLYQAFYYLRYFEYPIFYGVLIDGTMVLHSPPLARDALWPLIGLQPALKPFPGPRIWSPAASRPEAPQKEDWAGTSACVGPLLTLSFSTAPSRLLILLFITCN